MASSTSAARTTTINLTKQESPVLVNALRRVILQSVPNYAYEEDTIEIRTNTSVFNSDELKRRIMNFPVFGLDHGTLTFQSFITNHRNLVILNDTTYPEGRSQASNPPVMTLTCSYTHNKLGVGTLPVTTSECQFSVDGKEVSDPYRGAPLTICYLHPGEKIVLTASSRMATPLVSPCYMIANAFFCETAPGTYSFTVESGCEVSADEVFRRSTVILTEKIDALRSSIDKNDDRKEGSILFAHDKFTVGGLFTHYLQNHGDVEYAGHKCAHMLGESSETLFRLKRSSSSLYKVVQDITDTIKKDIVQLIKKAEIATA